MPAEVQHIHTTTRLCRTQIWTAMVLTPLSAYPATADVYLLVSTRKVCFWVEREKRRPEIQGHPMELFLKISVLQANFCWLGDVEEIICPWEGQCCWVKDNSRCLRVWGDLMSRITAMCYLSVTPFPPSPPPPANPDWRGEFLPLAIPIFLLPPLPPTHTHWRS